MNNIENYLIQKLIFQIDYIFINEIDITNTYQSIQKEIVEQGYDSTYRVVDNCNNFKHIDDRTQNKKILEFIFQNENIKIKLNKYSLSLEYINKNNFINIVDNLNILSYILNNLSKSTNKKFKIKRLHFNPTYRLIFKNINNLNNYFDENLFNYVNTMNKLNIPNFNLNEGENCFSINLTDKINLNLTTNFTNGEINNNNCVITAYQTIIDLILTNASLEYQKYKDEEYINLFNNLYIQSNLIIKKIFKQNFIDNLEQNNISKDLIII